MNHNPYLSPQVLAGTADPSASMRHSGLGIASFSISLAISLFEFILVVVATGLEMSTPGGLDENSPAAISIGLAIIGGGALNLTSIGLGIAALFQHDRKKLFAILGIMISAGAITILSLMIALGLAMDT